MAKPLAEMSPQELMADVLRVENGLSESYTEARGALARMAGELDQLRSVLCEMERRRTWKEFADSQKGRA